MLVQFSECRFTLSAFALPWDVGTTRCLHLSALIALFVPLSEIPMLVVKVTPHVLYRRKGSMFAVSGVIATLPLPRLADGTLPAPILTSFLMCAPTGIG